MSDAVLGVKAAITGRRSVRRFLHTDVDVSVVENIIEAASRAPSGMNMQPWHVHIVRGDAKQQLSQLAKQAAADQAYSLEYDYVPSELKEPYKSRRRKVGFDLYAKYRIDRNDLPARAEAMLRNYDFFGAPVGLFFTLDKVMAQGSWLDCGMFMQNVMLLARENGLETCPQQAWCDVGQVVHECLGIPDHCIVLSGMAMGYADRSAPENSLVTVRAPLTEFTTWHDQV